MLQTLSIFLTSPTKPRPKHQVTRPRPRHRKTVRVIIRP